MANIIDYLEWRGDLTLDQDPFNDVDSLILCQLAYMKFDHILTEDQYYSLLPLGETVLHVLEQYSNEDRISTSPLTDPKMDRRFLEMLAGTRRFGSMLLTRYENRIDQDAQEQFSALTILTGDGCVYIAFRGTDDSLVGWKEDFNMSFMTPVPAQQAAVDYLESVALDYPESIRTGGHSKGGNLAAYAAAFCQPHIQNWILTAYSNDGPGFDRKVIEHEGYRTIHRRIHTLVPQSSVVGMLLEHEESYTVIQSSNVGLLQHDPYSWEVLGRDFIRLEAVDQYSQFIDRTLRSWLDNMNYEQRALFIDTLYNVISAADIRTAADFSMERIKSMRTILKSMSHLDEPTKKLMGETLSALWTIFRRNLSKTKENHKKNRQTE